MIPIQDDYGVVSPLADQPLPTGQAFGLSVEAAVSDNPFTKMIYGEAYSALGNKSRPHGGRLTNLPEVNREQINARTQEAGVTLEHTADSMTNAQLELLIERAQAKRSTQERLNAIPEGSLKTALSFGGALWGGLQDPLNIAASFIPVVGEARWAEAAGQASAVARLASRVKYGVIEGAVGQALIEPLGYAYSQQIGDDYTLRDSLMNIAMGGVMGGLIHGVKGSITDAIEFRRSKLADVAPQEHLAITQQALSQLLNDQPVKVESMVDMARARESLGLRDPVPAELTLKNGERVSIEAQHEKVDIPPSPDGPTGERVRYAAKNAAGEEIGVVMFNHYSDGSVIAEGVEVLKDYRRQGVATQLYRAAEKDGLRITPSDHLSDDGRAFTAARKTLPVDPDQAVAARMDDLKDTTTVQDATMAEWEAVANQVQIEAVPRGRELEALTTKLSEEQTALKQQAATQGVEISPEAFAVHDEALKKVQTESKVAEAIAQCRLGRL